MVLYCKTLQKTCFGIVIINQEDSGITDISVLAMSAINEIMGKNYIPHDFQVIFMINFLAFEVSTSKALVLKRFKNWSI